MPSYIPEQTYGPIADADGYYRGQYGLIPWPEHLKPRENANASISATEGQGEALGVSESWTLAEGLARFSDSLCGVELTKKGEAYAERALAEADGVFFVTLDSRDRAAISTTIERLIAMLDTMEPDPDFEPDSDVEDGGDVEPSLGWTVVGRGTVGLGNGIRHDDDRELDNCDDEEGGDIEFNLGWEKGSMPYDQTHIAMYGTDEAEEENEHGGDVQDEPHDAEEDACAAGEDMGTGYFPVSNGGNEIARRMLRAIPRPARDPDQLTIVAPGVARIG